MNRNDKQQLVTLLNKRQYQEAVDMLQKDDKWDEQTIEMFVEGFDLRQFYLCKKIKDRLFNFKGFKLPWKTGLRLVMLKVKLANNGQ